MELRQLDRADVAPTTIVVFDDLSDDPATQEILRLISDRGHEVISSAGSASDDAHGNLFANMNRALDLAGARGFRLLHLVQDDLQLVRRSDELADRVLAILDAFPDACQVMVHFMRRLGIAYPVPVVEQRAYRMNSTGDLGFVDVRRLQQRGFRFQSSERASAGRAASLGLAPYAIADPVIARVPWPMHARHRRMSGKEKPRPGALLLKPLSSEVDAELRSRSLEQPPYGEDYFVPWGWRCWKPYPISPSYASWLKAIATIAVKRRSLRGLVPRRAGVPVEHDR